MTFPRAGAAAPAPTSAPSYSPLLHPSCEGRIPGPPVAQVQCPPSTQEDKSGFFFGSCLLILLSLPQKPPGFLLSEFSLIPDPSGNRRAKYRQKESGVLIPHAPPQPQGLLAPCPPPESSPPPRGPPEQILSQASVCLYQGCPISPAALCQGAASHAGSRRRVPRPQVGPVDKT